MTTSDQIIGVTGTIEMLTFIEDIIIHVLVNGKIVSTKIIASGLIHQTTNDWVKIEVTKITGVIMIKMYITIGGTTTKEVLINITIQVSEGQLTITQIKEKEIMPRARARKSIVLGTLCILTKVHKRAQKQKFNIIPIIFRKLNIKTSTPKRMTI